MRNRDASDSLKLPTFVVGSTSTPILFFVSMKVYTPSMDTGLQCRTQLEIRSYNKMISWFWCMPLLFFGILFALIGILLISNISLRSAKSEKDCGIVCLGRNNCCAIWEGNKCTMGVPDSKTKICKKKSTVIGYSFLAIGLLMTVIGIIWISRDAETNDLYDTTEDVVVR